MKVWLITGAARGFGASIARSALRRGDSVVAAVRDVDAARAALGEWADSDRFLPLHVDVTDARSVEAAVAETVRRFERLDVVVNNAGVGIVGAVEEVSEAEARRVFDVNVFGVLTVLRSTLPVLRAQGHGRIIMMSSMGGVSQPGAGWGVYGASKFALEGLSEALRHEVDPLGIDVTLVEPGGFRTAFLDTASLRLAAQEIADYAPTSGRTREISSSRHGTQAGDPERAAEAIVDLASAPNPPLRLPLGSDAVSVVENKIASLQSDLDAGRDVATSMNFVTPDA